jgi:hypothetical protein
MPKIFYEELVGEDTASLTDHPLVYEITCGIMLKRQATFGEFFSNVPHFCIEHSPTGYSWGYYGSGPADLALNCCEWLLQFLGYQGEREKRWKGESFKLAYLIHQEFKERFIARVPKEGAIIPYQAVSDWVQQKIAQEAGRTDWQI